MRPLLLLILLTTATLAGCAGDTSDTHAAPADDGAGDAGSQDNDGGGGPDGGSDGAGSGDGDPAPSGENHVPTARLTNSVASGPAPLSVTFGINGSDDDGDALSYEIDFDGDGAADAKGDVPDALDHVFDAVGTHTVSVTVSDGAASADASVTIEVVAPADDRLVFTADVEKDCHDDCAVICDPYVRCYAAGGALGCESFRAGQPGGDCTWFTLTSDLAGQPYEISSTGGDPDAEFRKSCDIKETDPKAQVGTSIMGENYVASDGPEAGDIPEGLSCLVVWEWNESAPSTITLAIG